MSEQNKPRDFFVGISETNIAHVSDTRKWSTDYHLVEYKHLQAEREKVRKLVDALKEIHRLDDEGDGYVTPFQNIAWKAIKEVGEV